MQRQNTVRNRSPIGYLCLLALTAAFIPGLAFADPVLPTIPSGTFTVPPATGNPTTDTANLVATINAAKNSANQGGTVVVPAGTYVSNLLTLYSNINLQLASGAIIQNATPSNTLINVSASGSHDIEITGSGTINGNATTTSNNNLISIQNVNNLLVSGVTIANSPHEHLVIKADNNVTVDGININDSNTSLEHRWHRLFRQPLSYQELHDQRGRRRHRGQASEHILQRHHHHELYHKSGTWNFRGRTDQRGPGRIDR